MPGGNSHSILSCVAICASRLQERKKLKGLSLKDEDAALRVAEGEPCMPGIEITADQTPQAHEQQSGHSAKGFLAAMLVPAPRGDAGGHLLLP